MKKKLQTAFSPRQYMLSGDFEIYYYSDCHSYNVKSYVHDYYEFYFFLEGDVSIHIHGEEHALSAGDMLLIPPGVPRFAKVRSLDVPYRRFVFWISRTYCRALSGISPDYTYLMRLADETEWYLFHYDLLAFKAVQAKVFRLIEEIHSERFGKAVQISVCVTYLILHLNRTVYEEQHTKMPCEEQGILVCCGISRNTLKRIFLLKGCPGNFMSANTILPIYLRQIWGFPSTSSS